MRLVFSLLIFLFCFSFEGNTQAADFVVVRKNGKTIKTILKGAYTKFITTNGEWVEGRITDIANDTVFFREVIVRQVATPWGVPRLDTVATPTRAVHYTEIAGVPRGREGFSYIKNGSLLVIGGIGFMLINLVNGAYLHYSPLGKENLPGLLIATGVVGTGLLLNKLHKPYLKIGKKYTLKYISVTTK